MKDEEYKLIPMSEITDEARKIAVAWMECEDKDWIGQKHKLASDIMNYAKKYCDAEVEKLIKERMPSNDEIVNEIKADLRRTHNIMSSKTHILIRIALDKLRSRLTKPGAETSQNAEQQMRHDIQKRDRDD